MSTQIEKSPQERIEGAINFGKSLISKVDDPQSVEALRKYAINVYMLTQDLGIENTELQNLVSEIENKLPSDGNIVVRSMSEFDNAGVILKRNKLLADKHTQFGMYLLKKLDDAMGEMTPELDAKMERYLIKAKRLKDEMNEGRKVFTQTLTVVAKAFTSEEARVDATNAATEASKIQAIRNSYATIIAKQKADEAARVKKQQALDAEKISLKAENKVRIIAFVGEQIKIATNRLQDNFNAFNLDEFDQQAEGLKAYLPDYKRSWYDNYKHGLASMLLSESEINELVKQDTEDMYQEQCDRFCNSLLEIKQLLVDMLHSKKNQLQATRDFEIEEAARVKKQQELQAQIDKADADKKAELQKQQDEEKRLQKEAQDQKAELDRQNKEREDKEREDAAAAIEAQNNKATEAVHVESSISKTQTLFTMHSDLSVVAGAEAPATKEGYQIEVIAPAGYSALFEKWLADEGSKMDADKLAKKLDFIIKHCEKVAMKDEANIIKSGSLRYNIVYAAVNKKK